MKIETTQNINANAFEFASSVINTAHHYFIRVGIEVNKNITVHSQENPTAKKIMDYLFDLMKN